MNDFDDTAARERALSDGLATPATGGAAPLSPPLRQSPVRLPAALKADCSRCAGLCCVVPAFFAVQGFGFDKPAHTACGHLTLDHRCAIHTELDSRGFPGCRAFDCYGAGQRVTQELLPGTNWRASDTAAAGVFAAYECLLVLHRLMALLVVAEATLPPPLDARMRVKRAEVDALCRSEACRAGRVDTASVERETTSLVRAAYTAARRLKSTPDADTVSADNG